jgi:hypothetical protein
MTVARLREEMSGDEFMHWGVLYGIEYQEREMAKQGR